MSWDELGDRIEDDQEAALRAHELGHEGIQSALDRINLCLLLDQFIGSKRAVLHRIAVAGPTVCRLSLARLARDCDLHQRTVEIHRAELVNEGILRRIDDAEDGRLKFAIDWLKLVALAGEALTRRPARERVQLMTGRGGFLSICARSNITLRDQWVRWWSDPKTKPAPSGLSPEGTGLGPEGSGVGPDRSERYVNPNLKPEAEPESQQEAQRLAEPGKHATRSRRRTDDDLFEEPEEFEQEPDLEEPEFEPDPEQEPKRTKRRVLRRPAPRVDPPPTLAELRELVAQVAAEPWDPAAPRTSDASRARWLAHMLDGGHFGSGEAAAAIKVDPEHVLAIAAGRERISKTLWNRLDLLAARKGARKAAQSAAGLNGSSALAAAGQH